MEKFKMFTRALLELAVTFILIVGAIQMLNYEKPVPEKPITPKEYTHNEDSIEIVLDSIKSLPIEQQDSIFAGLLKEYLSDMP